MPKRIGPVLFVHIEDHTPLAPTIITFNNWFSDFESRDSMKPGLDTLAGACDGGP